MSGDGKRYGFAHGCNTCHVSASTVGSWLIIDMDKGQTTSVFIELLMAPTEMSGDGKTGLFDLLSASTVGTWPLFIWGIEWINLDLTTVITIATDRWDIIACSGTVI